MGTQNEWAMTFFTNRMCNGRLGCFGFAYRDNTRLNFAVKLNTRREACLVFAINEDKSIDLHEIAWKKSFSPDDVIVISNRVSEIYADHDKFYSTR